jgi:uncharacterized protein (DUF58 family)
MVSLLPRKKSVRFVLVSALLTTAAIGVALISAVAGQMGAYELASLGSKAALALALVIVVYVVPRLAQSINFNSEFSVHIPNAGLLFFALILLVTILSLSSGNNLLYLVLAALLATMFVSWVTSRLNLNRIAISIRFPNHIFAGESAPFDVTVLNCSRALPVFSLAVAMSEQDSAAPATKKAKDAAAPANLTELVYLPIVPAKAQARARVERNFPKRGVYPVNGFIAHTQFPFGFIEQRRRLEADGEIVVYPELRPLDEFRRALPLLQGRVESRMKGGGSDLYAIRQYSSRDHHHHIDWKATAKTYRLMVREFTREDDWRVTILFDSRVERESAAAPEFLGKFEAGVRLAASLIAHFTREGAETRLITCEEDSGFGVGVAHSYKLFYQLARVAPAPSAPAANPEDAQEPKGPRGGNLYGQFTIMIASATSASAEASRAGSAEVVTFEEL